MANIDRSVLHFLQLPQKAKWNACQVMEPINLLRLSLCSKITRDLVRSSGLKCLTIRARSSSIYFEFSGCSFVMYLYKDDWYPGHVTIRIHHRDSGTYYNWTLPSFTVKSWIEHVLFVFNRDSISYLSYNAEELDVIQENFVGLNVHHLDITSFSVEDTLQILKDFPRAKSLGLSPELPESEFQKVLLQNFDALKLDDQEKLTLDNLLLCNTAHFENDNRNLKPKELNRFVKLWMKGSNPRLRSIKVSFKSVDERRKKEIVLRGINYQKQTEDRTFIIPFDTRGRPEEQIVSGGYEIFKKDGTMATIMIDGRGFEMYIWS